MNTKLYKNVFKKERAKRVLFETQELYIATMLLYIVHVFQKERAKRVLLKHMNYIQQVYNCLFEIQQILHISFIQMNGVEYMKQVKENKQKQEHNKSKKLKQKKVIKVF